MDHHLPSLPTDEALYEMDRESLIQECQRLRNFLIEKERKLTLSSDENSLMSAGNNTQHEMKRLMIVENKLKFILMKCNEKISALHKNEPDVFISSLMLLLLVNINSLKKDTLVTKEITFFSDVMLTLLNLLQMYASHNSSKPGQSIAQSNVPSSTAATQFYQASNTLLPQNRMRSLPQPRASQKRRLDPDNMPSPARISGHTQKMDEISLIADEEIEEIGMLNNETSKLLEELNKTKDLLQEKEKELADMTLLVKEHINCSQNIENLMKEKESLTQENHQLHAVMSDSNNTREMHLKVVEDKLQFILMKCEQNIACLEEKLPDNYLSSYLRILRTAISSLREDTVVSNEMTLFSDVIVQSLSLLHLYTSHKSCKPNRMGFLPQPPAAQKRRLDPDNMPSPISCSTTDTNSISDCDTSSASMPSPLSKRKCVSQDPLVVDHEVAQAQSDDLQIIAIRHLQGNASTNHPLTPYSRHNVPTSSVEPASQPRQNSLPYLQQRLIASTNIPPEWWYNA